MLVDELREITAEETRKLEQVGIRSAKSLLRLTSTPTMRSSLARRTGLPAQRILGWVNRADLLRVDGVGPLSAHLLERAGVDSVPELATRNPESLHTLLGATPPETAGEVQRRPGLTEVARWVRQARGMRRVVHHRSLMPAVKRRLSLAILRLARRANISHLDHDLITAVAMHLYGQDLLKGERERELLVPLDQLSRGTLLQLERRYANGKEVKLSTVLVTLSPEGEETVALRWHVRLPVDQVPADMAVGSWMRYRPGYSGRQVLQPVGFRRMLSLLSTTELTSVHRLFSEDLQNEAVARGSFKGKAGVDILRQWEAEIDPQHLIPESRLYIERVEADRILVKVLGQRIRLGVFGIQLKAWIDRTGLSDDVFGSTTRELLAAGDNEAIALLRADGGLEMAPYRTLPAPVPQPRRQEQKNRYAAAAVPPGLRERLRAATAAGPVGPGGLKSAVIRGSVHIHWHYYEATGYLNGRVIWRVLIINDQVVIFEQMSQEKTEEQGQLETEVEQHTTNREARQVELEAATAEIEQLETEIGELASQQAEEEQAVADAEAAREEADTEVADLRDQYGQAEDDLASEQDLLEQDQQDLEDEQSEAADVQEALSEAEDDEADLEEEEELLAADLQEQEDSLALAESEAAQAEGAADAADTALTDAEAELAAQEGRYSTTIVDRATWGARPPNTAAGYDEYPDGTPLPDLLDQIVVHHTADPQSMTVQELQNWEMDDNGYADVPYHFVITEDGTVYEGRSITAVGAHAGVSTDPTNTDITQDPDYGAIGIVVTGDFDQDLNTWFPDTPTAGQLASLQKLAGQLCRTYSVDPAQILKHSEVVRGGDPTVCPGENLAPEVERIRTELAADLPGYDAAVQAQRDRVAELTADRDAKQAANQAASARVSELQDQVSGARDNLEVIRDALDASRDEVEGLQGDLDAHLAEAEEISERASERESTIEGLQETLSELSSQIGGAEGRSAEADQQAQEHRDQVAEIQGEVDAREQRKGEVEQEKAELEQEIAELQGEIDTKQPRIDELEAEIGTLHDIGDEDSLDEQDIEFEADYEDPWTLLEEDTELGQWEIGKLRAIPNAECPVCGLHQGEEYGIGEAETPYHPNCDCTVEELIESIQAR